MVYVAKRCQKYLFLRFLPGQPSVPVHLPAVFRPLRRALQCCRGGCSLPFLFPSCPSFSCACSLLESPSPFPRGSLGSGARCFSVCSCASPSVRLPWFPRLRSPWVTRLRVLLRALATPVRGGGLCCCLPVLCLLPACRVPSSALADACRAPGKRGKGGGRRGKMPESAGRAGKIEKKVEKGEKKSLKSLEIRQRALPLQSRSGRGPLGLLRGSGEVH